jgi:hypothetical protein
MQNESSYRDEKSHSEFPRMFEVVITQYSPVLRKMLNKNTNSFAAAEINSIIKFSMNDAEKAIFF